MNKEIRKVLSTGVIAGVVGGIIFGLMMQMRGMMGMVAAMMGSESLAIGWMIHMVISVIFGLSFGIMTTFIRNVWVATLIFGVGIWIVGPLVVMPMMMGMGTNLANAFTSDMLMSLGTHLFFSIILAIVFKARSSKPASNSHVQA
jgi:hypothetical protein